MTITVSGTPVRAYASGSSSDGASGIEQGLMIGGGVTAAAGVGTAGYATYARHDLPHRRIEVTEAQQALVDAQAVQASAQQVVDGDRVHPPAGTSADDALAWARGRFNDDSAIRAITNEGTTREVAIGKWGTPMSGGAGEALDAAFQLSDGRAGGVIRAGEWRIPVRLADDLDALEKSRQVAYTDVEYGWHSGPNPAKGGAYEYHYGPHEVTKYRTERYLDPFASYRSSHDGFEAAFTDDLERLHLRGTKPELALEHAQGGVSEAAAHLDDTQRAVRFAESRAGTVRGVAIGAAVLGGAALAAGYLLSRD